jgi:tetratricopeptide (TPR) repeat protein
LSYSSSHPKRGRGAIEEKSLTVPVVDNAQGEDEKALSAATVSRQKASEAASSDFGSGKSGSMFEEVDKVDESKSEGALTASNRKECQDATKELARAGERTLPADKLFHLRRALRLCPEDPRYHLELAALYRSLGRDGDAIYEYHEAARVDPDNQEASTALKELGSSAG